MAKGFQAYRNALRSSDSQFFPINLFKRRSDLVKFMSLDCILPGSGNSTINVLAASCYGGGQWQKPIDLLDGISLLLWCADGVNNESPKLVTGHAVTPLVTP